VSWGGDQSAKDGGVDVRVALSPGTKIEGFIPRGATGFRLRSGYATIENPQGDEAEGGSFAL